MHWRRIEFFTLFCRHNHLLPSVIGGKLSKGAGQSLSIHVTSFAQHSFTLVTSLQAYTSHETLRFEAEHILNRIARVGFIENFQFILLPNIIETLPTRRCGHSILQLSYS